MQSSSSSSSSSQNLMKLPPLNQYSSPDPASSSISPNNQIMSSPNPPPPNLQQGLGSSSQLPPTSLLHPSQSQQRRYSTSANPNVSSQYLPDHSNTRQHPPYQQRQGSLEFTSLNNRYAQGIPPSQNSNSTHQMKTSSPSLQYHHQNHSNQSHFPSSPPPQHLRPPQNENLNESVSSAQNPQNLPSSSNGGNGGIMPQSNLPIHANPGHSGSGIYHSHIGPPIFHGHNHTNSRPNGYHNTHNTSGNAPNSTIKENDPSLKMMASNNATSPINSMNSMGSYGQNGNNMSNYMPSMGLGLSPLPSVNSNQHPSPSTSGHMTQLPPLNLGMFKAITILNQL